MKITKEDRKQLKRVLGDFSKKKSKEKVFYNLCFTICAPMMMFSTNIQVIEKLKRLGLKREGLYKLDNSVLTETLLKIEMRPTRFYNNKTKYIMEAKRNFNWIYKTATNNELAGYEKRELLVKNIKGMGMKAVSHFLRNLGHDELAIIDTHIIKYLSKQPVADWQEKPTLEWVNKQASTIKGYDYLESWFQTIAGHKNLTTAELDAWLWKNYSNTSWSNFRY